jgi:hypothetical protein
MFGTMIREQVRQKTADVTSALAPVRDHAVASAREALLAVSSLFAVLASNLDRLRSQTTITPGTETSPVSRA